MIIYIREKNGQTRFVDSVGLSSIFGMRTNRAKADRRATSTNNWSKRLLQEDMKVRFSLHYLKKNMTGDEYSAAIEEGTRFAEEKLFSDL